MSKVGYKQKSDAWGTFTKELSNIQMYESDIENYKVLKQYAKLINIPEEIIMGYERKIIFLTERIEYINKILNSLYWKDKELLIRCYVKRYSNKLAGSKFGMSDKSVNTRLGCFLKNKVTPMLDMDRLK
ncbi:MAG TPA: hypothetical protein DCR69_04180 [Clostridium sp.]|nr:hypothetical protein [Clostridium sp.]